MRRIYIVGTTDTKAAELGYLAGMIRLQGAEIVQVDLSTRGPATVCDVTAREVASHHPQGAAAVLALTDRGVAVAAMGIAFARFLQTRHDIAGIIGIGGSGGTSIIATGLRDLPYGVPKLLVTTLAAGNTAPYIGISDLILMPAVTDLAGLNSLSRVILHNAAMAISGMALHPAPTGASLPALGLTMFGVTTACVTALTAALQTTHDCLVFHATGTGGTMMEKLVDSGLITGLLDITTTEVADLLCGGTLACGPDRFGAAARTGIGQIVSLGALDMVNFGNPDTVPPALRHRLFHHHNPAVTLMRTTAAENARIGHWIAAKLNQCPGPTHLLIPEAGLSALDAPGQPFHDPAANAALFDALQSDLVQTPMRHLTRLPHHINDPAFAAAALTAFHAL